MTAAKGPSPIIVSALLGTADFAYFDGLRREHFPPERNHLAAHLTLFNHLAPELAQELKHRLKLETHHIPAPQARVTGLVGLGRGVAFRIDSPELAAIRMRLADAFDGMLTPQDRAGWRPHITIQNKVTAQAAKALQTRLEATFAPRHLAITGLASWWYRGGPWEPLSKHMFAA